MKGMRFVIGQDNGGEFHWRLVDDDGADLAVSARVYDSATAAGRAATDVHLNAGSAPAPEHDAVLAGDAGVLG
jgi:uncharacterized protein YegP (UPF0339 family)